MSLLAASVPVAVLVLAWDETAPAVRALVEATETTTSALDSIVVLVPAEAGELTQEEFMPLVPEPTPLSTTAEVASPSTEAPPATAEATSLSPAPADLTLPLATPTLQPVPLGLLADVPSIPAPQIDTAPAPLAWAAVRVLHLSSFSLPELTALSNQALPQPIWQSSLASPAAPYLGSQSETARGETTGLAPLTTTQLEATKATPSSLVGVDFPLSPTLAGTDQPEEQPLPALPSAEAPDYLLAESPVAALDAEADLAPIQPEELTTGEASPTEAPLDAAAAEAQTDWVEALASLRTPLPIDERTPTTDLEDEAAYYAATTSKQPPAAAGTGPAELRPPRQPFEAPNLNFQVIQYARFAVPLALAQAPFAAIYAPAWPTWLAAQELRYRTRQPLVLHVATLAANAGDSLATATGWQAELQRQALHRADLILAETPELTRRLRHDLGLAPELVRTVPAADAAAVAQALRTAQVRPSANLA
jgi:hypothetical protein